VNPHEGPGTEADEGIPGMKYFVAILAIALGVTGVVAGEADDSPGLQLLGVLLILGVVVLGARMFLRSRRVR
jgi:drug/metabolite transporter (DMT)-like permease